MAKGKGPGKPKSPLDKASKATKKPAVSGDGLDIPDFLKRDRSADLTNKNKPKKPEPPKKPDRPILSLKPKVEEKKAEAPKEAQPGRDNKGRFKSRQQQAQETIDKLYPPNTTDDVEEPYSPPKPRAPRKPREKKPGNSTDPLDKVPFYSDPVFDLGAPERAEAGERAKEHETQRYRRQVAQSILKNFDRKKSRKAKQKELFVREALRQQSNDNTPPPTEEQVAETMKAHSGRRKKFVKDSQGRPTNDNQPELTQEELAAEAAKHLANARKRYRPKDKFLDPANDPMPPQKEPGPEPLQDDGVEDLGNPSRGIPPGAKPGANSYNRFSFRSHRRRGRGGAASPSSAVTLFNGKVGHGTATPPGMKLVHGKVTFRKPKKDKKHHKDKDEGSLIAKIIFGIMAAISLTFEVIKNIIAKWGNDIIDGINSITGGINSLIKGINSFTGLSLPTIGKISHLDTGKNITPPSQPPGQPQTPNGVTPSSPNAPPPSGAGPQNLQPNTGGGKPPGIDPNIPGNSPGDNSASQRNRTTPDVGSPAAPGAQRYLSERGTPSAAMSYFMSVGWTKAQAAGIVGNLQAESQLATNPQPPGDGGQAYGIAQWHPDRQAVFKNVFGKDIHQSTFKEQMQFVHWELTQGSPLEQSAGRSLAACKDAATAAKVVDSQYERSSGAHVNERIANAQALANDNSPTPTGDGSQAPQLSQAPTVGGAPGQATGNPTELQPNQGQQAVAQMLGVPPSALMPPNQQQGMTPQQGTQFGPYMGGQGYPSRSYPPGYQNGMQTPPFFPGQGNTYNNSMYPTRNYGGPNYYGGSMSGAAVSPNANIIEQIISQAGNLRQGRMHPFALPGMGGGANPMQLIADASAGGTNGLMNVGRRLFNSPSMVNARQNFPYGNPGSTYNPNSIMPNQYDPYGQQQQQNPNDGLVDSIVGSIGGALSGMAQQIMGGLGSLGGMISQSSQSPGSIAGMHMRDPRISQFDNGDSFVQREMLNPHS